MDTSIASAQHALAVGIMALGLTAALYIGSHMTGLRVGFTDVSVIMVVFAFVAACACCILRLGHIGLAVGLIAITSLFAIIALALLETAMLATGGRPFADPLFAAADLVIAPGLNWYDMATWFRQHPIFAHSCEWVYHSIAWQPFVLIISFCCSRHYKETWRFIGMWTFSLIICQVVFAFYPGVGAYYFYHVNPNLTSLTSEAVSSGQLRLLKTLRDPALKVIDSGSIGGIITFPSFHAVAAVLLGRGFWRIPGLRWPFSMLNVAMLATAIPMGGHYVVDVVAGVVIATFATIVFDAPPFQWKRDVSVRLPFASYRSKMA